MARTSAAPRVWRTVEFAADYLHLNQRTIRRYITSGRLPAHRVGGTLIRIDQADLDRLIRPLPAAGAGSGRRHRGVPARQGASGSDGTDAG